MNPNKMVNYKGRKINGKQTERMLLPRRHRFEQLPEHAKQAYLCLRDEAMKIAADCRCYVFGSYASGRETEASDFDVFIEGAFSATQRRKFEMLKVSQPEGEKFDVHYGRANPMRGIRIPEAYMGGGGCCK